MTYFGRLKLLVTYVGVVNPDIMLKQLNRQLTILTHAHADRMVTNFKSALFLKEMVASFSLVYF